MNEKNEWTCFISGRRRRERSKSVGARVVAWEGLYSVERSGWTNDDERALSLGRQGVKKHVPSSHHRILDPPRLRRHRGQIGLTLLHLSSRYR